jgi:ubiquinone/menaquinone biosynthesis C-methylase UbiE
MQKDYRSLNADAWDYESKHGNIWTDGCTPEQVEQARHGILNMTFTPMEKVRPTWINPFLGKRVLALASGGGQQAVLLAAAGCDVTEFDISPSQLAKDREMANQYHLDLRTDKGDMQDLSCYEDGSFDLVYNPCSTCFVEDVLRVYRECHRVLAPGGYLFTVATNPALYMFDEKKALKDRLKIKYTIPYSDVRSLSEKQKRKMEEKHDTFEFSHTLEELVGGICQAGFSIEDFYTGGSGKMAADSFLSDCFLAIKARKR